MKRTILLLATLMLAACGVEAIDTTTQTVPVVFVDTFGATRTSIALVSGADRIPLFSDEATRNPGDRLIAVPVDVDTTQPLTLEVSTRTFGVTNRFVAVVAQPSPAADDAVYLVTYLHTGSRFVLSTGWRDRDLLDLPTITVDPTNP